MVFLEDSPVTTVRIILCVALVALVAAGGCKSNGNEGSGGSGSAKTGTAKAPAVIDLGWAETMPLLPVLEGHAVKVSGYLINETKGWPRLAAKPADNTTPGLLLEFQPAVPESTWKPLASNPVLIEGEVFIIPKAPPGSQGLDQDAPAIRVRSVMPASAR
jgi:hypothetical protein